MVTIEIPFATVADTKISQIPNLSNDMLPCCQGCYGVQVVTEILMKLLGKIFFSQ